MECREVVKVMGDKDNKGVGGQEFWYAFYIIIQFLGTRATVWVRQCEQAF